MTTCTFHPDRETALSCTACDRPACPDCLTPMAVGQHCVGCTEGRPAAGAPGATAHRVKRTVIGANQHERLRRPGWVFYALLALFLAFCVAAWLSELPLLRADVSLGLSLVAIGVVISGAILSLVLHEWAHAVVAFYGGDHTVVDKGYLTMDVRKYAHPFLSIGLPLLFLLLGGLPLPGGAVYLEIHRIRSAWRRTAVALAGPAINLVCALVLVAIAATGVLGDHVVLRSALLFLAYIELAIVFLNLIPLPGLDGYNAIEPHLPRGLARALEPLKAYTFLILLVLIVTGSLSFVGDAAYDVLSGVGVSPDLLGIGYELASPQVYDQ